MQDGGTAQSTAAGAIFSQPSQEFPGPVLATILQLLVFGLFNNPSNTERNHLNHLGRAYWFTDIS